MSVGSLQFALLGLISSRDDGIHGYRLKTEVENRFGDRWAVGFGQVYRALDRLERSGLVAAVEVPQVGRPPRKVYRITAQGRTTLHDWLALPPRDGPNALRDDLAVKLLVRSTTHPRVILELVVEHRSLCLRQLSRLNRRRARLEKGSVDGATAHLLLLQADMRMRSDLAWLDVVEKEIREELDATAPASADGRRDGKRGACPRPASARAARGGPHVPARARRHAGLRETAMPT